MSGSADTGQAGSLESESSFWRIKQAVLDNYGIQVLDLKKTKFGTAKCFLADTNSGRIFIKIYQEKHDHVQITKEIMICKKLTDHGFKTSEYVRNLYGDFINTADFGIFTIQKFIEGITYEKFQVPRKVLFESAEFLADIHGYLEDVPGLQEDFTEEWIAHAAEETASAEKVENIIKMAEKMPSHERKERVLEDCRWKLKVIPALAEMKNNFDGLTRKNSHGDYNTYQWICENEKMKAVIDFGSCSNLPVIWELIRSYTYAGNECADGRAVNADVYCEYLKTYLRRNALSQKDLQQGFSFYFYTLAMSTFGYKQYIQDCMKGKYNPLIKFAFWRTQMCQYLYENAAALDEKVYGRLGDH